MTARHRLTLFIIRDAIASMPPENRAKVEAAEAELRAAISRHDHESGLVALSLIGAEAAVAAEES